MTPFPKTVPAELTPNSANTSARVNAKDQNASPLHCVCLSIVYRLPEYHCGLRQAPHAFAESDGCTRALTAVR